MTVSLNYNGNPTVLRDFGRTVRDEPYYLVFKHKIFVEKATVPAEEVVAWLRKRYVDKPRGHRYRVVCYAHQNGNRYVDYILMETVNDADLLYMKMKWGYSEHKVQRGERLKRKRLTPEQKARLDAALKATREAFYATL